MKLTSSFGDSPDQSRVLKLSEDQRSSLVSIYVKYGYAADQLGKHHALLFELTDEFNNQNGTQFSPGKVLEYILNQRKQGFWVRLGRDESRQVRLPKIKLNLHELNALKVIYLKIGVALDNYLFFPQLAMRLSEGFLILTGRDTRKGILVSYIMNLRKAKQWITLDTNPDPFEAVVDMARLEQSGFLDQDAAS